MAVTTVAVVVTSKKAKTAPAMMLPISPTPYHASCLDADRISVECRYRSRTGCRDAPASQKRQGHTQAENGRISEAA